MIKVCIIGTGQIGYDKFTYEYLKDEISGYHHEVNAEGSKFKHFVTLIEKSK